MVPTEKLKKVTMCCSRGGGGVNQTYIGQNNQLVSIFDIISLVNQEMVFESSSAKSLNLTSVLLVVVFFWRGNHPLQLQVSLTMKLQWVLHSVTIECYLL